MTNLLWYICVAIISTGIAVYSIFMKKDTYKVSTLIVFYLFASAITWIGEFIVLGFFNSYAYKTGVFVNPWAQNILGHLLLNTTMYPAAATVMVAYSLRYGWISLATFIFVYTEYLFVKHEYYTQHWWKYYMSVINVVAFMLISRQWFYKMNQKRYGVVRAVTFYFVAMIIIHFPAPILLLLGKQHYQMGIVKTLVGDIYLTSTIIAFIYHLIESFVLVVFICILRKWYWKALPFIISPLVEIIFSKANILILNNSWKLVYTLLVYDICILVFVIIEKYTLKPQNNNYGRI